jgi:hypothetical protein
MRTKKLSLWQAIDLAPGAINARDALKRMLQDETLAGRHQLAKSIVADLSRMEKFITVNGLERYAHRI